MERQFTECAEHLFDIPKKPRNPRCPKCNNMAVMTYTPTGWRAECCGLWSWAGYKLACAETHAARRHAHDVFDPLWKEGLVKRGDAYRLLAKTLGVKVWRAHMRYMDLETAKRVPDAVMQIRRELKCMRLRNMLPMSRIGSRRFQRFKRRVSGLSCQA